MPLDLKELQKKFDKFFEETTIEEFEQMILENRKREAELSPPTTEQIELWKEVLNNIELDEAWKSSWQEYYISMLQKQFTITRKQEVPEAVRFAEWAKRNDWLFDPEAGNWFHADDKEMSGVELFQLFKRS